MFLGLVSDAVVTDLEASKANVPVLFVSGEPGVFPSLGPVALLYKAELPEELALLEKLSEM